MNEISYYQLNNLIENRVPFMFYNMGSSITDWYSSVSRMHVQTYEQLVTSENILPDISQKKVPSDYAIVLLCQDGRKSRDLAKKLTELAYTNVYVVNGGHQQMVTDRQQI